MADKKITLEATDPLLLFGSNDVFLRRIEAAFPDTQIIARGNQILLDGEANVIEGIEQVIHELIRILTRNGDLTENDVETVLALYAAGDGAGRYGTDARDVIVYTPNGGVVRAKTRNQEHLVGAARTNDLLFAVGPAGTGKTYTAVALAVAALKSRQVKRIVLSRPAVEAGERLGFLPGDFREKIDPYLRPLYDALEEMLPADKLRTYMEQNVVEILPLAYMRGRTLHSAFVILDEAQNATTTQMKMFLTRLGVNSRAIVTGDITQSDLPNRQKSGLVQAQHILEGVEGIEFVYFDRGDVVRHRLVKDIIDAYDRYHREAGEGGDETDEA